MLPGTLHCRLPHPERTFWILTRQPRECPIPDGVLCSKTGEGRLSLAILGHLMRQEMPLSGTPRLRLFQLWRNLSLFSSSPSPFSCTPRAPPRLSRVPALPLEKVLHPRAARAASREGTRPLRPRSAGHSATPLRRGARRGARRQTGPAGRRRRKRRRSLRTGPSRVDLGPRSQAQVQHPGLPKAAALPFLSLTAVM